MLFQHIDDIDWLDQVAHVLVGCAITFTVGYVVSWWVGLIVSMAVSVIREYWQHPGQCQAGCRTDIMFWLGGSLIAVPILWLI